MKKRDLEKLVVRLTARCEQYLGVMHDKGKRLQEVLQENDDVGEDRSKLRSLEYDYQRKIRELEGAVSEAKTEAAKAQKRANDLEKEHSGHADFLFPGKPAKRDRLITQSIGKAMELAGVDTLKIPLPAGDAPWRSYKLSSDFCIPSQEWTLKLETKCVQCDAWFSGPDDTCSDECQAKRQALGCPS